MTINLNRGRALSSLSMTPLIDVVFLLLIFFLVVTTIEEEERLMDLDLPQASEAKPLTEQVEKLYVEVDINGQYFISKKKLTRKQLFSVLQQASENNPGRQTVIIRAHKKSPWQAVLTVMALCNRANIRDYHADTSKPGA